MEQAMREAPNNREYRARYLREKEAFVNALIVQGNAARAAGSPDQAENFYRKALVYDPQNPRAAEGLANLREDLRLRATLVDARKLFDAGNYEAATAKLRPILILNPEQDEARGLQRQIDEIQNREAVSTPSLKASFKKTITMEFRDANLKSVFEVISRTSGINFIFDKDVRPDLKATIFVRNTTIEEVLNLLLVTNQLDKRILNDNTVLIYPNTPAKAKDYQDLIVKSFYLANADVKQTLNMIKTLVKTRDVFIDEKLNLLIMRDTPEAVRLAEKLIATQDLGEPEVVLEVEILEISASRLMDLGIHYPEQASFSVVGAANTPGTITYPEFKNRNSANVLFSITNPAVVLNLKKQDGDVQTLANPRIRVKNHEKAKIHIGSKVPVITTTTTANVGTSDSVTYLDVGLKLDVEPTIYLDNDVGMKVGLEVSNVTREVTTARGLLTYEIGSRTAATNLRLKDGETQVLAGLIQDDDRKVADKIPGLGDIPLLGRLFSSHRDTKSKTEIVLLITPHIVRNLVRPESVVTEFASGTETAIGAPPLLLRSNTSASVPLASMPPTQTTPSGVAPFAQTELKAPPRAAPSSPVSALPNVQVPNPIQGTPVNPPSAVSPTPPGSPPGPFPPGTSTTPGPGSPGAPQTAPRAATVSIVAPAQAAPRREFTANINVGATTDIKSASVTLSYDPSKLEAISVAEGNLLNQDGTQTDFRYQIAQVSGRVTVTVERPTGIPATGTLGSVTFRSIATAPGTATLGSDTVSLLNGAGASVPAVAPVPSRITLTP